MIQSLSLKTCLISGLLAATALVSRAEAGDTPALRVATANLAGVYKNLKGSPLGSIYQNAKVKEYLEQFVKPMGVSLTGTANKAAIDALDRLLLNADGPAQLAIPKMSADRNKPPGFAVIVGTSKPASVLKDAQAVLKSAPKGSLDEKTSAEGGKKTVTYTVKTDGKGAPAARFPFDRLTLVEGSGSVLITSLDAAAAQALVGGDAPDAPRDGVWIHAVGGALRPLLKSAGDLVPSSPAEVTIKTAKTGLVLTAKFPGANRDEAPFRYLGAVPATVPRPGLPGAHTESAATLNIAGLWDTTWATIQKRSPVEYFAYHATLLEFEKNLGVKIAAELIPALDGSAALYGAAGGDVIVFKVAKDEPVKKALTGLAAMGGGATDKEAGLYEIAFGERGAAQAMQGSTWYARLTGGFLALSTNAGLLKSFPAAPGSEKASGPVASTVDVQRAWAAYHAAWQAQSIAKKQGRVSPFPPAALGGRLGRLTVQSSNLGGDLTIVADLTYAKGT